MPVKTLRTIAIAFVFVLPDIRVMGVDVLPDIAGLALLFPCFVLMTEYTAKFGPPALFAAGMALLEAARLLGLMADPGLLIVTGLIYVFLSMLMMLTWADAVKTLCTYCKQDDLGGAAATAAYAYAATVPFRLFARLWPSMEGLLWLIGLVVSLIAVCVAIYYFHKLRTPPAEEEQAPSKPPPEPEILCAAEADSDLLQGHIVNTALFLDEI